MRQARPRSFPQNLPFELGENREQARVALSREGDAWIFRSGKRAVRVTWDGTPPRLIGQ